MPNRNHLVVAVPVVVVLALVVLWGCAFTVNERELVVVTEFGRPVRGISQPGLNFKTPFVQDVRRLPKTKQFWANSPNDMLVDLPTGDGKKIEVSAWAIWRITDPQRFVTVLQTQNAAEKLVRQRIRASIRNIITSHNLSEAVRSSDRELTYSFGLDQLPAAETVGTDEIETSSTLSDASARTTVRLGREALLKQIREQVQQDLASGTESSDSGLDRGIEIVDVGISSISFTESVRQAAFRRLIAFMESVAAGHTNAGLQQKQEILNKTKAEEEKILGEGEEQSKRLRGEVEAEIIEMYAKAIRETGDFYNFQRTLEVYESALGDGTRLILTTDSDLFRMLKQVESGE